MGDLISIGTMICGASAINALTAVIDADREDQAISIASVFVFSIVALIVFFPIAQWGGLSDEFGGLWAGLAVNDLSSSVAVGSQFGDDAEILAAATKSIRIMLLGPLLILFAFLRRASNGKSSFSSHFRIFLPSPSLIFAMSPPPGPTGFRKCLGSSQAFATLAKTTF